MTYRVYCDGLLLYHSALENLRIFSPTVELEVNKTGSFIFTVQQDHPYYGLINRMKSIITVYQDDDLLFRGRVLDEEVGWHNERKVICEGELAFLLDSIQRPFEFVGGVAEFLTMLLDIHSAQTVDDEKRFWLGDITVTGGIETIAVSSADHAATWDTITKKLVDEYGGYLLPRHEDGMVYLDYLREVTRLSPQRIEFGKNLIDLKRKRKGADIATVIVPIGAKVKDEEGRDTGRRLTIEAVNGGADFIEDKEAQAQFGIIVKSVVFDDVTDPEELKRRGQAELAGFVKLPETVELTAADLAGTGANIASFHVGTAVDVFSRPHGIEQRFVVNKLTINLLEPGANKMVLGAAIEGFAGALQGLTGKTDRLLQIVEKNATEASQAVYNVERNMLASLQVTEQNIQSTVAENYYLKDQTDALVSSVSTEFEQTKNSFEMQFSQFSADIEDVAAGADAEFEEIRQYIRFVDGKILLGEVGNELELEIANDRISFLQDGAEVAFFSDRKLFVTDAQILHSLQLGNFAFMPRTNGNLSFKRTF